MKPGDLVRLKSGGPVMTVISVNTGGAICAFYRPRHEEFAQFAEPLHLDTLEPVKLKKWVLIP